MKLNIGRLSKSLLSILVMTLMLAPFGVAQAASARAEVVSLVRALGYGAGIHHFKNYVLRGQPESHAAAKRSFTDALQILQRLENSPQLTAAEQPAVATLQAMIQGYRAGLERVAQLRSQGWRLEDIDRSVTVDDSSAINALDLLRGRWQWSDLEQIEYLLGYGKGIHNFKNYVLRQHPRYHTQALENLLAVESLIVNQFNTAQLSAEHKGALEKVGRVVQSYRNYLALVERLHAMQRTERQIDLAVKVNDRPALAGLAWLIR